MGAAGRDWVIVTGGGTGIGTLLVHHFAEHGFRVLTCGRRQDTLEVARDSCSKAAADRITLVACDIAELEGRSKLVSALPNDASVRLLVQNAAVGDPAPLELLNLEHWEYALRVNVTAPLFLVKAFLEPLKRGSGRILHLGTSVAFRPQYGTATYGVTKAAFFRLYQQLNADLKGSGIVTGSLSPGVVDTEGVRDHIAKARSLELPHVAFFDAVYEESKLTDPRALLQLFDLALCSDDATFASHEWNLRDLPSVHGTTRSGSTPQQTSYANFTAKKKTASRQSPTMLIGGCALSLAFGAMCGWMASCSRSRM